MVIQQSLDDGETKSGAMGDVTDTETKTSNNSNGGETKSGGMSNAVSIAGCAGKKTIYING